MKKRISSRGVIIKADKVYTMFRRKTNDEGIPNEYYVIPGGGIEELESLQENVVREIKEEFSVDVRIIGYLGKKESKDAIAYFFSCEIIKGEPILGGEELERCTESNYYEIRKISINELDEIDILYKDMILKAYNEEFEHLN